MRSSGTAQHGGWPSDMVITITDDDQRFTDLLWVRALHGLAPAGPDVPPPPLAIGDLPASVERLAAGPSELHHLISHEVDLVDGPAAFAALAAHDGTPGKVLVRFGE